MACHFIQQVSKTKLVACGDRDRIAKSKIIKLVYIRKIFRHVVNFIDDKDNRFATPAEHVCHFIIRINQALSYIRDENDHICNVDGNLCLRTHLGQDDVLAVRFDAAGINQRKSASCPFGIRINPVARDAWRVLHNGDALPGNFVEEGRFADIWPPHNGDQGLDISHPGAPLGSSGQHTARRHGHPQCVPFGRGRR